MTNAKPLCGECDEGYRRILHRGTGEFHRIQCACRQELPLKFVYQPDNSGCCVAAVAMIVGESYFNVKQLLRADHDLSCNGLTAHEVDSLLDYYGYAVRRRYKHNPRLRDARDVWPCDVWADFTLCEVINTRGSGQHAVVLLRDGQVLDPWWGVLQGLHRYPEVVSMAAVYKVE